MEKIDSGAFFERLREILDQETQNWWAEKISVSQGTISNCYKNKFTTVDKIIKILSVKQISPTWLIFGSGPKELKYLNNEKIEKFQDSQRDLQARFAKVELENIKLRKKLMSIQNSLDQKDLISLNGDNDIDFISIITVLRTAMDVIFKMAELFARHNIDISNYSEILSWIKNNIEVQKHSTAAAMENLNKIIKSK